MIPEHMRIQYAGLYLLKMAQDEQEEFSLALAKEQKVLEPIFLWLYKQEYVVIASDNSYAISPKGGKVLRDFIERYKDFLQNYDVYCAVDLQAGEFALSYYHEFDDEDEWLEFLEQDRWEDLRIAVAEYRGLDPIELVAMTFMNDGDFGESDEGWDYELLLGSVWENIEKIVNSAIKVQDLSFSDGNQIIKGSVVIEDIIQQGEKVLREVRHS